MAFQNRTTPAAGRARETSPVATTDAYQQAGDFLERYLE